MPEEEMTEAKRAELLAMIDEIKRTLDALQQSNEKTRRILLGSKDNGDSNA